MIYQVAQKQSLLGVIFDAVRKMQGNDAPPLPLLMQWTATAEKIRAMNQKFYDECARLTKVFGEKGRKTAVLKGQANSLLYPDQYVRQPGDIDFYVEGGKESVVQLLDSMGMLSEKEKDMICYHHVHIEHQDNDIEVEVHFRPTLGVCNPFCNKRLQKFLTEEIQVSSLTETGFYSPTMKFALAMQLAHIQGHFIEEGIGLRQITDYYMLLKNSTSDDRAVISQKLDDFGMKKFAATLMYVLKNIYNLDENLMLCPAHEKRGKKLLNEIIGSGNFGWYRPNRWNGNFSGPMGRLLHSLKYPSFYPREVHWYWFRAASNFISKLPIRIKHKKWSLR